MEWGGLGHAAFSRFWGLRVYVSSVLQPGGLVLVGHGASRSDLPGKHDVVHRCVAPALANGWTLSDAIPKSLDDVKGVVKLINSNLNNTSDWKLFEEAFNNADKDFLKKIKELNPKLTPNDLKLCAYLRLNLSSKEIAPLLNISVRSVEIKRYRLRKKMELEHEESLVEYILSI